MDSVLEKYRDMWAPMIQPDDYEYTESDIAPRTMVTKEGIRVERNDFEIMNATNKRIACSLYEHQTGNKPLVIYSHSHSGNKAEGAFLLEPLIDNFSLLIFDYTGYGKSSKAPCTLGVKEHSDLLCVITHVRDHYNFSRIYLWGRSMGAVSVLLLAHATQSKCCDGIIVDSPFSSTKEMLCIHMEKVPNFALHMIFPLLGAKLLKETGYDIMGIDLNDKIKEIKLPIFFIVGLDDNIAGAVHVRTLYENYGGSKKMLRMFEGEHAEDRSEKIINELVNFLMELEDYYKSLEVLNNPLNPIPQGAQYQQARVKRLLPKKLDLLSQDEPISVPLTPKKSPKSTLKPAPQEDQKPPHETPPSPQDPLTTRNEIIAILAQIDDNPSFHEPAIDNHIYNMKQKTSATGTEGSLAQSHQSSKKVSTEQITTPFAIQKKTEKQ